MDWSSPQMQGLLGAIVGTGVGIAGGVYGTWCTLKHAKSVEEKRLTLRYAGVLMGSILLAVGLGFVLPTSYRFVPLVGYFLIMPLLTCRYVRRMRAFQSDRRFRS